jgi:hypothetical protein
VLVAGRLKLGICRLDTKPSHGVKHMNQEIAYERNPVLGRMVLV